MTLTCLVSERTVLDDGISPPSNPTWASVCWVV